MGSFTFQWVGGREISTNTIVGHAGMLDFLKQLFPFEKASRLGGYATRALKEYTDFLLNMNNAEVRQKLLVPVRREMLKYTPKAKMRAPYYHGKGAYNNGTGAAPFSFNKNDPVTNDGSLYRAVRRMSRLWDLKVRQGSSLGTVFLDVAFKSIDDIMTGLDYAKAVDQGYVREKSYTTRSFMTRYKPGMHRKNMERRMGNAVYGMPLAMASFRDRRGKARRQPGATESVMNYELLNLTRYEDGGWESDVEQKLKGGKKIYGHQFMAAGMDMLEKVEWEFRQRKMRDILTKHINKLNEKIMAEQLRTDMDDAF